MAVYTIVDGLYLHKDLVAGGISSRRLGMRCVDSDSLSGRLFTFFVFSNQIRNVALSWRHCVIS